ncbi:fumarate reductase subunit FrdC [Photorhabdus temperata]|uniref:Fumarate reductase subunit C n=2 Tax=Photorhabdus temperata TaxID=574560 RepID=A0A081RU07_PHOTE|nr:fumarate reductase subunit FrdC [Photorhabdus temperata]EQC00587.1 fumarate reductase subunit C [Photorhabdus temperata subsp. temperata M1021]ERT11291.1 fumarate reductase subunit C [Photorhabdus temperata J3]KER02160.1 fumarate reductase subunit C [Photorhabdus temperata subsp. temperata Meg1]MCT8346180.1 fumarate reductase subunit FrdC [Photorhabdus temperata]
MMTKRKPYVRSMAPNWWQKLGFYRFYILRESTAVTTVWFSILLIYGVFALKGGTQSWDGFVTFLQNPVILLINIVTLLGALLHTKTWFELAPKAANIVIKGEKMGPEPVIKLLWAVTIIVTAIILGIALL